MKFEMHHTCWYSNSSNCSNFVPTGITHCHLGATTLLQMQGLGDTPLVYLLGQQSHKCQCSLEQTVTSQVGPCHVGDQVKPTQTIVHAKHLANEDNSPLVLDQYIGCSHDKHQWHKCNRNSAIFFLSPPQTSWPTLLCHDGHYWN